MSRHQNQAKALLDAWDVVVRFRWQFIIPTFLVATGVLALSLLLPRKYAATAIFERRMDTVMEEITTRGGSATYTRQPTSLAYEIAGEVAIDAMLKDIADEVGTIAERRGKRVDAFGLRSELLARVLVRRDVATKSLDRVRVQYTGNDPELARLAVNTLVQNYIARTRQELDRRLVQSKAFFKNEAARSREQIEQIENQKLTFEIEHAELLPDNPNNIQMTMSEWQLRSADLGDLYESAKIKAEKLRESLQRTPPTVPTYVKSRNPERDRLERELAKLRAVLNTYVAVRKMRDEHPDLIDLRDQIGALQLKLARTPAEVVTQEEVAKNPKYADLDVMLTQAAAEAEALQRQWTASTKKIQELDARSAQLFPVRAEYSKMERDVEQALRQLAFWESNLNRVNMSLKAESGDRGIQLAFVKPCGQIDRPVSPDLMHVLMAAMGLGLVSGVVSVLFAHRTNESFQTGEELSEAINLPLTGAVSEIISPQQRRIKHLRRFVLYPLNLAGMTTVLLVMVGLLYVNVKHPQALGQAETDGGDVVQPVTDGGLSAGAGGARD